ncbi:hypothetical protein Poli38472_006080 [Pythium oligandrum]|uniref:Tryptophan synthase beta chain-like PALP domain-containing protein n=1 Tax=Pythium oligandrum TaxID=41045 RepID=A0A8K1FR47_PYTOL|nr:hypothetical protein Poli38472_006080 [Pythium oligandrum]|eukprot:TMW68612.1 hypothetical protein Poli38472_006080 [Pythium oligandrum]
MLKSVPYSPPEWAKELQNAPAKKLRLGAFPTPIFPFAPPGLPEGVKLYIKREDFCGMETSGNKIRRLEFIFQDVVDQKADCIVTCGGAQSNHCRAAAVAARWLGIDSHLVLITDKPEEDPGLVGNLMFYRLLGAKITQCSFQEFIQHGSQSILEKTCERLREEKRRPYLISLGGSGGLGTWGYLSAVDEIQQQLQEDNIEITDIAFGSGSGGTAAGIALGAYLQAKHSSQSAVRFDGTIPVHAYIVVGDDEYVYKHIDEQVLPEMGAPPELTSRDFLQITDAQGKGYSQSTDEELEFITEVARATGVVVDPVYSGKALFHLVRELNEHPEKFAGRSILFVHTGGQFCIYDKTKELQKVCDDNPAQRFKME